MKEQAYYKWRDQGKPRESDNICLLNTIRQKGNL